MKKYFTFLLFCISLSLINAKVIDIPDANFKRNLLEASTNNFIALDKNNDLMVIDSNGDGEIQEQEALAVYKLFLNSDDIYDITGIEYFTNLKILSCSGSLTKINLSGNINLEELNCSNNKLKELDVSKNIKLRKLFCYGNDLTKLDVSKNIELMILLCFNNKLATLDLSENGNIVHLDCSNNNLTELDVSKNIYLYQLQCSSNNLTELDLSKNIYLYQLQCSSNNLTELDLSKNINIDYFDLNDNPLVFLNLKTGTKNSLNIFQNLEYEYNIKTLLPNDCKVCVDDFELKEVTDFFANSSKKGNQQISSDCSNSTIQKYNNDANLKSTISIYPNPVKNKLTIDSKHIIKLIELYDINGKLIKSFNVNDFKVIKDLSVFKSGTYVLKISTNNGEVVHKIIKQ